MQSEFATITSKGQLVIPVRLRRKYALKKGTRVAIGEDNGRLVLQPITDQFIKSLQGCLKGDSSILEFLLEERKREREL